MGLQRTISVILTGSTGMVGEGVLHICLESAAIGKVLVINRRPCEVSHPKLTEIIHSDFFNFSTIESRLKEYDACLFCLGVSSVGMKEPQYFKMTYTLTLHMATTLARVNPSMAFLYISGASTDSTEKGKSMWARVKGKTENDLMKLPFKGVYAFRPAFMKSMPGMKRTLSFYKYIAWIYPIGRALYPKGFGTLRDLGLAMIVAAARGNERKVVEVKEIEEMAASPPSPSPEERGVGA